MNHAAGQPLSRTSVQDFLATVWPVTLPTDSEFQRRKKLAVRSGQLAMVVMVLAAVGATVAGQFHQLTSQQIAGLTVASLLYVGWSLRGMRDAVRLSLWERGAAPGSLESAGARWSSALYFAVQLGLAALMYYWGDQGRALPTLWLVLLPPVAHGVILLRWPGITLVSALSMAILLGSAVRWHGWDWVPIAALEFGFAVVFTLVFTLLAVSSEKARGEVQRLAGELTEANRKLREYAVQAEELAATRERNRLAREIHDTLGHYLTVVNVQIEAARALQERDLTRMRDALAKAQSLTQEGLREIRNSVAALRASPLDNKPLAEALRQVVDENRAAGLSVEMQVLGEPRSMSPQAELTLYRAGQEGLTNVRKHAQATTVRLALDYRDASRVCLGVSDNGAGAANTGGATSGFGLLGLRERAHLLGGEVRVRTAPGAGFVLEVEVPG